VIEGAKLSCPVFPQQGSLQVYLVDMVFLLDPGQWNKGAGILGFFSWDSKLEKKQTHESPEGSPGNSVLCAGNWRSQREVVQGE